MSMMCAERDSHTYLETEAVKDQVLFVSPKKLDE